MKNQFLIPPWRSLLAMFGVGPFVFLAACGQAQTVAQHVGLNNPTNESWGFGVGTTTALAPDALTAGSDDENYWRIKLVNDQSGYYSHNLTTGNLTDPSGWTATLRAKVN